ncbi:hypothetical protein LC653_42255 [Nostoc sp. CHAB 5784]|uniref:hypothetical protein n=1 Tax=Nostoc mirabile TaxID=2907820 RepID=UPI001E32989D|nr:hypothetical protein [Nostoc mirabile]MCC5670240.1 hypothetical protein [Nostoc mirabile CHAB5784]
MPSFESDVYDGLSGVATSSIPKFPYPATYYQQSCSVARQGKGSKSRIPSLIRWLMLTSNLCNANFKIIRFLHKTRNLR